MHERRDNSPENPQPSPREQAVHSIVTKGFTSEWDQQAQQLLIQGLMEITGIFEETCKGRWNSFQFQYEMYQLSKTSGRKDYLQPLKKTLSGMMNEDPRRISKQVNLTLSHAIGMLEHGETEFHSYTEKYHKSRTFSGSVRPGAQRHLRTGFAGPDTNR